MKEVVYVPRSPKPETIMRSNIIMVKKKGSELFP